MSEALDNQLRDAGMMTVDEMIERLGSNPFMLQREVVDMDSFEWWIEMRCREFSEMQARKQLKKEEDDDMFEWVLAHAAVFTTVLAHYRKAKGTLKVEPIEAIDKIKPECCGNIPCGCG